MAYFKSEGLRGSELEEMINMTNDLYQKQGLAVVQKIPTPINAHFQHPPPVLTSSSISLLSTILMSLKSFLSTFS